MKPTGKFCRAQTDIKSNEKGQLSIFFATSLVVIISLLAFIINVGVFIKSKINLQNAVDAAAYAGASVQARQLTNIAYLNWEMRNTYKEWMFKYYVLGNLNLKDVAEGAQGSSTDLTMDSYNLGSNNSEDKYNFPSVCVDLDDGSDSKANCRQFVVMGLPSFGSQGTANVDATFASIKASLVQAKSENCVVLSTRNYLTNLIWTFNIDPNSDLAKVAPKLGTDRMGAYPQAFELAVRMRNLEALINSKPESGVCEGISSLNSGFCQKSINDLISKQNSIGLERINKAYFSAYRNLGIPDDGGPDNKNYLQNSFTLTELAPTPFNSSNPNDLSNVLIPQEHPATQKYYLDLKIMQLNLSTFYTMFSPSKGDIVVGGETFETEGRCSVNKTGFPIPGYPLGYVKNPEVMTYYAVKGQAKFVGMFNPFNMSDGGITLTAYAAAKPFGGRIGPALFNVFSPQNFTAVFPRNSGGGTKNLSSGYISGFDTSTAVDDRGEPLPPGAEWAPGSPIPMSISAKYWMDNPGDIIGGYTTDRPRFSIPNLAYDFPGNNPSSSSSYYSPNAIQVITTGEYKNLTGGLYNPEIFNKFRSNLPNLGNSITPAGIAEAILRSRAPTKLEALNYLIPTPEELNESSEVDSWGLIGQPSQSQISGDYKVYDYSLYAPLFSDDSQTLYKSPSDVIGVMTNYFGLQTQAVKTYIQAMNFAASAISAENTVTSGYMAGTGNGDAAAKMISDIPLVNDQATLLSAQPSWCSMAGKFAHFFLGSAAAETIYKKQPTLCQAGSGTSNPNIKTFFDDLTTYWVNNEQNLRDYYTTTYTFPTGPHPAGSSFTGADLYSAYAPGPMNDGASKGIFKNVLRKTTVNMKRNYYSTKFITLKSLVNSDDATFSSTSFPMFSEGNNANSVPDIKHRKFVNKLNDPTLDLTGINH